MKIATAIAVTAVATAFTPAAALASPAGGDPDVEAFIAELSADASTADDLSFIQEFSELPPEVQSEAVLSLADGSFVQDLEVEESDGHSEPANAPSVRGGYEWVTWKKWDVSWLGIKFAEHRQEVNYVSTGSSVYSVLACNSTFTGFTGFWTVAPIKNDSWVSGGRGACQSIVTYSLLWEGTGATFSQRLLLLVDGYGNWEASIETL